MIRIYLTGEPLVETDESVVRPIDLSGRQGRLVLTALAWNHDDAVPRGDVAEILWPADRPPSWEATLAAVISNVRRGLPPPLEIEHATGCYRLRVPTDAWVDVEAAYGAAHAAEGAIRLDDMADVYAWTGVATAITKRPFLVGEDGPWVEARRRELTALRIRALDAAIEFCTWNDEWGPALRYIESLIDLDPLRESSYRRLMTVSAASGDRAGAARAYERCRAALAEELGVSPHAETEALYDHILEA